MKKFYSAVAATWVAAVMSGCVTGPEDNPQVDLCEGATTQVKVTGAVNDGAAAPVTADLSLCFPSNDGPAPPSGSNLSVGCSDDRVSCSGNYCMSNDISGSGCAYFMGSFNNSGYPCVKSSPLGGSYKTYSFGCVVAPSGAVVPVTERCYPVKVANGSFELKLALSQDDIGALDGQLKDPQLKWNGRRSWGLWLSGASVDREYASIDPWSSALVFSKRTCDKTTGEYQADGHIQFRVF